MYGKIREGDDVAGQPGGVVGDGLTVRDRLGDGSFMQVRVGIYIYIKTDTHYFKPPNRLSHAHTLALLPGRQVVHTFAPSDPPADANLTVRQFNVFAGQRPFRIEIHPVTFYVAVPN